MGSIQVPVSTLYMMYTILTVKTLSSKDNNTVLRLVPPLPGIVNH